MVQLEYYLKLHSNINPCKKTTNFEALGRQFTAKKKKGATQNFGLLERRDREDEG
jgi:hypothetical protein